MTPNELWNKYCVKEDKNNPTDRMFYDAFIQAVKELRMAERDGR